MNPKEPAHTTQVPRSVLALVATAFVGAALHVSAQTNEVIQPASELKKLSLDQLFEMEVTSVSKKPEKLSETAAAIHVVTDDDIRRSGALSIPEALRDIPGVEVARVDSHQYAITARGFNGTAANKLLVMIDGRSVYTPLFSGVFWDVQDAFMEDVDRIEVIRGPGATVWGANAVNGVINVLTKSAEDTQGLLITGGGGNEEQGFGGIRYGGQFNSNVFFRAYGKGFGRDDTVRPNGDSAEDQFQFGQGGFRVDWKASAENLFTLQGDVYQGSVNQSNNVDNIDVSGGNVLGRWTHRFDEDSDLQIQIYYDRTERNQPPTFAETLDTFDFDMRDRFSLGKRQDIVWGLGYRLTENNVQNGAALAFRPSYLSHSLFTGFIQDEIKLVENKLHLTLGTKLEHNDYSGFEYQPSGRISWMPATNHTLWAAASRAVRTPSRIDRDLFAPGNPPFILVGGRGFDSEKVYAFELGYKVQPTAKLNASIAAFYNIYDDLRSLEAGPPFVISNGLEGEGYGVEVEASYQLLSWWRLNAGYSFLDLELHRKPGSTDISQENQEGDSPHHQYFVKSRMDLPHNVELDTTFRYVDDLPNQGVRHYLAFDVHLGWHITKDLEVAVVGQNLLDPEHPEFGTPATRKEIQRSVYGKVTCRF